MIDSNLLKRLPIYRNSIEDLASAEYEKLKTLSRQLENKLYSLTKKRVEKSIMSIEWLLTKTTGNEAQNRPTQTSDKQDELSGKTHDSKPSKRKQATEESDEERPCRAEHTSSIRMQDITSEVNFRCRCGYEGIVNHSTTDFKLLRTDNNGLAYFECSNCRRHFQYNLSTGRIKVQKNLLRFLLGKFS